MKTEEIIKKAKFVNNKWLECNPQNENTNWAIACYFIGCVDAYKTFGDERCLSTALQWCENNNWGTLYDEQYATDVLVPHFTVEGKLPWRFEKDSDYLYIHADHITCGLVYMALKELIGDRADISKVMKVLDFTADEPHNDYWWWVDSIHMALCLYHKATLLTGDEKYANKGHALYLDVKDRAGCYDYNENLWYRDHKYFPENALSSNGKKIFWSRGNGWVYAGLIQTMEVIGKKSKYYSEYEKTFLEMTDAIMKCRSDDGFWRIGMYDHEEFPMPETSGTLLFVHSMIKAVRLGVLDKSYIEIALDSFNAVNETAVLSDGTLGWVQGVAQCPGPIERECTRDYAVGYYLMICCELLRYIEENETKGE